MLEDKNIKPIESSTSQDQSGESMELSQSITNENISQCTEENNTSTNLFRKFKNKFIRTKMTRTIIIKGGKGNKKSKKCEYSSACSSSSDNHSQSNECSISNSSDCIESNKKSIKKSVVNKKVDCEDCSEANEWDKLNK